MESPSNGLALDIRGVSKRFAGIHALEDVSFSVRAGRVHAIVGENGAGKSTLMKILAGVCRRDAGEVRLFGEPYRPSGRPEARSRGISIVYQEPMLCPNLSVAENIFLGSELPGRFPGSVDRAAQNRRAKELLRLVRLDIAPDTLVERLSVAKRTLVQIARALGCECRVLILDEPTASLTESETETLFGLIRELRSRGVTVLYISHKIEEIFAIGDTVTVLKDGAHVWTGPVAGTSPGEVVARMVGREFRRPERVAAEVRGTVLRLERLARRGGRAAGGRFREVSLEVRAGEIVALAGLVGSGRTEVLRAVFGIDPVDSGRMFFCGRPVQVRSAAEAVELGMGLVPEDRKLQGLVLEMALERNLSLARVATARTPEGRRPVHRRGVLDLAAERELAREYVSALDIRARGLDAPAQDLSGGNQQKVVIGKWLALSPRLLLLDEPTQGIDVGAKAEIHRLLRELARQGVAVLMVSGELPEVLSVSDRVYVMHEGVVTGELEAEGSTEKQVMALATRTALQEGQGHSANSPQ